MQHTQCNFSCLLDARLEWTDNCYRKTCLFSINVLAAVVGVTLSSAVFESKNADLALGLNFLETDPLHERRGAASSLLSWVLDNCTRDLIPAYLESTVDTGPL